MDAQVVNLVKTPILVYVRSVWNVVDLTSVVLFIAAVGIPQPQDNASR